MEPIKRETSPREREIKRAGHHRVRRELKRALRKNPKRCWTSSSTSAGMTRHVSMGSIATRRRFKAAGDVDPGRDS